MRIGTLLDELLDGRHATPFGLLCVADYRVMEVGSVHAKLYPDQVVARSYYIHIRRILYYIYMYIYSYISF